MTTTAEWTPQDSLALDHWARKHHTTPLTPDPHLHTLLTQDRHEAPRTKTQQPRPTHCQGPCRKPLRPNQSNPQHHPGTVEHAAHGLCRTCNNNKRRQQRRNHP